MNSKMYVGNLPFETTEDELRAMFEAFGAVTDVHLPMDRDTGRPRGFAFVTMESASTMNEAIQGLNGKDFNGRDLAVNEARPKEERTGFGGGGGGGGGRGGRDRDRGDRGRGGRY